MLPVMAQAAEHNEEAGEVGVPFTVTLQAINFFIFVAILVWLLRGPVKNYFYNKEANFKQALARAENAKLAAIAQKNEMAEKCKVHAVLRTMSSSIKSGCAERR